MIHDLPVIVKKKKRVGRGIGRSGAKSGRGQKGQKSRAGYSKKRGFEGGQTPLYMRLPKLRGAKQRSLSQVVKPAAVKAGELNMFHSGSVVGIGRLRDANLIGRKDKTVKIISGGKLEKKLTVRANAITDGGRRQIEGLGGKVELI